MFYRSNTILMSTLFEVSLYFFFQINNKLDSVGWSLFNNIDCALMGYAIL